MFRPRRVPTRPERLLLVALALGFGAADPSRAKTTDAGVLDAEAVAETEPAVEAGDAIDDPAIWVDPHDPSRSLILAANHGGDTVEVYDLSGKRLQRIQLGGANNVDLRTGFRLAGEEIPLVTVIGGGEMRFFRLDPVARRLENVTKGGAVASSSSHGVCMYRSRRTGAFYAFRVTRFGPVDQFELVDEDGRVDARRVRRFDVEPEMPLADGGNSALEACVADDEAGSLFVVEEEYAIWRYGAEPGDPGGTADRVLVDTLVSRGGHIVPQIEGLAVVHDPHGDGFLIASDQGDYTFNVYRRLPPHDFVRKVRVVRGANADGCERTDGIEVTTAALPGFPRGVFICQDNVNQAPAPGNQNMKLVPLEAVVPLGDPQTPAPAPEPEPEPAPPPAAAPRTSVDAPAEPAGPSRPAGDDGETSGYWLLDAGGRVHPFGDARDYGHAAERVAGQSATDVEPTPTGSGYWVVESSGTVHAFGDAVSLGGAGRLAPGENTTSLSATPTGRGYWLFTSRGRVFARGDASHLGDMVGTALNAPVLDSVATPTGNGYYMVAADGGIFSFGDARFFGSMGGHPLNEPVRSLVPDPDGAGYWLVAADGGVFAFDAPFRGSMGDRRLNAPVTGMVAFGSGYLMVATDGGIFNFSDRPFLGSLGGNPPDDPVVAVAAR